MLQVMPYVAGQFEAVHLQQKDGRTQPRSKWSSVINLPVGVKVSVNLMYPLQLTAGAEYVIDLVKDIAKAAIPYEDVKTYVYKPLGAKRDGINVYAGFRICL